MGFDAPFAMKSVFCNFLQSWDKGSGKRGKVMRNFIKILRSTCWRTVCGAG